MKRLTEAEKKEKIKETTLLISDLMKYDLTYATLTSEEFHQLRKMLKRLNEKLES